jgi:LacI family transcriptional regulator, galactose operon repressor
MRDVAALAGVSLKTVSRVVNGEPTVAAHLAERVRVAAAKLSYQPNLTASNLRRRDGKSFSIGLLVQDMANPFSAAIFRAAENVAAVAGVSVLASSLDEDPVRERQLTAELIARRVDGLIIVPAGQDHRYLQPELRAGTAVVFADRPPGLLAADTVVADHHGGALAGVGYLLARGHRRIAYLGDLESIVSARERYAGYRDALAAASIPASPALIRHGVHSRQMAQAACTALLTGSEPPTALFTAQNLITVGAVRALRGLHLERSVALLGFDDFDLADLLQPSITVVAQDPAAIGRLSAELLLRRIGSAACEPERHVIPTRLIVRESADIPPGG